MDRQSEIETDKIRSSNGIRKRKRKNTYSGQLWLLASKCFGMETESYIENESINNNWFATADPLSTLPYKIDWKRAIALGMLVAPLLVPSAQSNPLASNPELTFMCAALTKSILLPLARIVSHKSLLTSLCPMMQNSHRNHTTRNTHEQVWVTVECFLSGQKLAGAHQG